MMLNQGNQGRASRLASRGKRTTPVTPPPPRKCIVFLNRCECLLNFCSTFTHQEGEDEEAPSGHQGEAGCARALQQQEGGKEAEVSSLFWRVEHHAEMRFDSCCSTEIFTITACMLFLSLQLKLLRA